jgi:hypothetical protein
LIGSAEKNFIVLKGFSSPRAVFLAARISERTTVLRHPATSHRGIF